jgi:hypothetical protein
MFDVTRFWLNKGVDGFIMMLAGLGLLGFTARLKTNP